MRKQYHFWPGEHGLDAWDVDRLVHLSRGLPAEEVPLAEVDEIDSAYWAHDGAPEATVRDIVEHMRLVMEADLSYPVILGPGGRVMDGMHRIARALFEGRATISAVRLPSVPDPDYHDCRPEELPYDD